jgi:hypothetical protein
MIITDLATNIKKQFLSQFKLAQLLRKSVCNYSAALTFFNLLENDMKKYLKLTAACALALSGLAAHAADWSDTSIGISKGSAFREPFNPSNIGKTIYNFENVSGYKYGTNFFNVDMLQSDGADGNAQEAYAVYRNTVDYSKVSGTKFSMGPLRDIGATFGFDWNTKNDLGYGSRKRMLVVGPTAMFDVPGFLNVSLLFLNESNQPVADKALTSRYTYKTHPELDFVWGIPLGTTGLSFEGFGDLIASKGLDEFGNQTAAETHIVSKLMYNIDAKKTFRVGFEYEYWNNKFGNNNNSTPFIAGGAKATTPMLRAEYHF